MGFESSSKKIRCSQISLFIPFISSIFQPMAFLYFEMTVINFSSCSSESNDEMIMGLDFRPLRRCILMFPVRALILTQLNFLLLIVSQDPLLHCH